VLTEAFRSALAGRSAAVLVSGDGGVGKTMAVRDLCSGRFAHRSGMTPFPVARIDFDHLDPRYPDARPAELLAALSGELTPYNTTRHAEKWFRRTDDAVTRVHEQATAGTGSAIDHPLLDDAVEAFAGYLRAFDGPVVLVLDTCEELAKLHPPGGRAPAVDQTFALLERIHDLAPDSRVVLAGRRWLVPPPPDTAAGLLLDPRPYLRVVRVGGFTRKQADAYLALRDPDATLPQPLRTALITRSGGAGKWNPFDLACYCDWALAEPGLAPEAMRTDGDPYIEQRIIARLPAGAVRDCLPVAVELGRFDRGMIAPELHRRGVDVEAAFSGLVGQEWVSAVTFEPDGRAGVIEVDPNLRPRLHTVLVGQPERFPLDRARLGRDLAAHLRDRPLDEPAVTAVESTLRLLPAEEAGLVWEELERRIAATPGAWAWAGPASARAAAAEAPRALTDEPTILAAIRATQAAVLLRQPGGGDQAALWREVAQLADRHPDPAVGARLAFRAACALLDADGANVLRFQQTWRGRPALVDDAMVAALDRLTATSALPPGLGPALDELCRSPDPPVSATALLARAAAHHAGGRVGPAVVDVEAALRLVDGVPVPDERIHWCPGRLRDRARLARLVLALTGNEPPGQFPLERWRAKARPHLDDIDAERLTAAAVFLEHCWHPVDPETGRSLAGADRYQPLRLPTHTWHDAVPSLCRVAATIIADGGDPAGAAAYLRSRREQAVAYGRDAATIGSSDELLVALSRAFRTTTLTTSVHRATREATGAERLDAWATLALVRGESPATPADAGGWSTWLRTQIARQGMPLPVRAPADEVDAVDRLELAVLAGRDQPDSAAVADGRRRLSRGLVLRDGACADLAAALRTEALCGWPDGWQPVFHRLPPRLVSQTALAEAELLALRLPAMAVGLLHLAGSTAQQAGDRVLEGRAAVLLVLTLARAGADLPTSDAVQAAVRNLPAEDPERSGWPARRDLALELLTAEPRDRSRPAAGGSPELDIRAVGPADEPTVVTPPAWIPAPVGGAQRTQELPAPEAPPARARPASPSRRPRWPRNLALAAMGFMATVLLTNAVLDRGTVGAPTPAPPYPAADGSGATPAILEPPYRTQISMTAQATRPVSETAESTWTVAPTGPIPGLAATGRPTFTSDPSAVPVIGSPETGQPTDAPNPSAVPGAGFPTASSDAASDTSAAWLGFAVVVGASAALALLVRALVRRVRYDLSRPLLVESASVYTSASRTSPPLPCRITTTPSEIVFKPGSTWQILRRRSRWSHPVSLLLGQRHGNLGRQEDLVDRIVRAQGCEPLFLRFRQSRLPLLWRLWDEPPVRSAAIGAGYRGPANLAPRPGTWSPNTPGRRAVLHLIGTPVSTAGGWRLRIPAAASSTLGYRQRSRSLHVGEELVGTDDLAVDSTALVVLQAEPVDGPPQSLGEQYEGVCALAADIRDAGAGAVLVVPPLPDDLARRVVDRARVAMTQRRHRTHPVNVLDLAQSVKDDIARAEPPTGGPTRASRDVLLFA